MYRIVQVRTFAAKRIREGNDRGLLRTTQEAVKHFGEAGGSIINIGSVVSHIHPAYSSIYTSTKGAVDSITGVLARELGPRGIRVNSINPGLVMTEGIKTIGMHEGEFYEKIKADTALGRVGAPGDYGAVAVFLASDDAHWVTGEALKVAGGNR